MMLISNPIWETATHKHKFTGNSKAKQKEYTWRTKNKESYIKDMLLPFW